MVKLFAMILMSNGEVKIYKTKEDMDEKEFIKRIRDTWGKKVKNVVVIEERETLAKGG